MFEDLTQRLSHTLRTLTGKGYLSESNIQGAVSEIRDALLEADVALPVVTQFIDEVTKRALGQAVLQSLSPGDTLVNIVHEELIKTLGDEGDTTLNLQTSLPTVILLAGLQGSGKTTTAAKLGKWIQTEQKKSVMVVSTDVYRPAAIEQLARVAEQAGLTCVPSHSDEKPRDIANHALKQAKKAFVDVLIIDTAGRLHIDQEMMTEISDIHQATAPTETLFVVDSMTGQDAANSAKAFYDVLPLTGVILTKTDGDSRGGAALSVKQITTKPIKFIGNGEHLDALDYFDAKRMAGQILGQGDIIALAKEAQRHIDEKDAARIAKKVKKGSFNLADFRDQLLQMEKMGGLGSIMSKLPGMGALPQAAKDAVNSHQTQQMVAMIDSMTPKERRLPDIINGSRKRRITQGSGTSVQKLNQLLKQFKTMQKMMKKLKGQNMSKMMEKLSGMMPPNTKD